MNEYIQLNDAGEFLRHVHSDVAIEWDENNCCVPDVLVKDGKGAQFNVHVFQSTPIPEYDSATHDIREVPPVFKDGVWTQQWEVFTLDEKQVLKNQAAKDLRDAKIISDKIEALWAAADSYVSGYISGVAIGILTIGTVQQRPKALAVTAWSSSIWAEYYTRKAQVTVSSQDNHDFTGFGPMPFSVPELQAEIGL